MDSSLAHRIRLVFPQGVDWEHDEAALESNDQVRRLSNALSTLRDTARVQSWFGSRFTHEFVITHPDAPTFEEWIWRMDNQSKIDWIRRNDSFYVALWFKVSRVADYYIRHFNHWHPRGDTGYLDADTAIQPDAYWQLVVSTVEKSLDASDFALASPSLLTEPVSFVVTWGGDFIPDNDPRWDDLDFEPPPVAACVYNCLFGDQ